MIMISSKGRYALRVMTYLGGQCRPGVCTTERDSGSGEYFSEVS